MASLTFSTLHHLFPGTVVRATVSHVKTRLSTMDEPPAKTMNSETTRESGAGFPSARASDERTVTKTGKDLGGSVVEKPELTRHRNVRKNVGFRERRRMGSSNSSLWFKNENNMVETSSVGRLVVNEKMEKKPKKGDDKEVGKENKGKGFKKSESPEFKVKLELDMCSRRGDVLSAIQLYDKALKEGIKLGQYHYTVLLYLCSSAAVGVIRPAKSGSGGKSLNTLGLSNGVYSLNSMGFNALPEKGDRNLDDAGLNITVLHNEQQVDFVRNRGTTNRNGLNYSSGFDNLSSSSDKKENSSDYSSMSTELDAEILDGNVRRVDNKFSNTKDGNGNQEDPEIQVGKDIKTYALQRGFEIYKKMCMDNVPMNEATLTSVGRMAMSMGDGDLAFDMVKQMKPSGINPRLRSYSPALFSFCNSGDIDKAFAVEKHMLENGICPEEPELEALLRLSIETGKGNKVYYLLHKLRASVRKVSPTTADLIVKWFSSKAASRVGKTKWDKSLIKEAIENGGGGWHGQGWLGKGRWSISYTTVGADGMCKCCGGRLAIIDLDPKETEDFAESVASIATKKEKNSSFQKFQQKWLDYYGPFEAVVDAANIGLFSQKRFLPSRVSAVVNGIRQKLPSKKWPLIVLHNKRITGSQMDKPEKRALIEKWKYADALYATPTGSNDDWYWLYAAIKFKCLLVTNDEMRDHIFQLLGNDFFPKWKERHQVRFRFSDGGPIFYMPPPCSVVIQESDEGHWHIPVASENEYEAERTWICVTRARSHVPKQDSATSSEESPSLQSNKGNASSACQTEVTIKPEPNHANQEDSKIASQEIYKSLRDILSVSLHGDDKHSILSQIEAAEIFGNCIIDFQI